MDHVYKIQADKESPFIYILLHQQANVLKLRLDLVIKEWLKENSIDPKSMKMVQSTRWADTSDC